jgi:hypothetical protein
VVTGTQADGTPSRRHVITDADNGKELFSCEAIETGVGNTMYSGQVTLGTSPSYTLTRTVSHDAGPPQGTEHRRAADQQAEGLARCRNAVRQDPRKLPGRPPLVVR